MRKVFALAATALFICTSCSSDDNTNVTTPQDNTLLKKTVTTDQEGNTQASFYTYDGNKIVSILDENGKSRQYAYTGNLITKIKVVGSNYEDERTFEYNSNNQKTSLIIRYKYNSNGSIYEQWIKYIYTYNQNGTVTAQIYVAEQENEWTFSDTSNISYTENSIKQKTTATTITTIYDTKNSPMKNVLGFKEYMLPEGFLNNAVSESVEGSSNETYTYNHTYNNNNYPISSSILYEYEGQSPITNTTQYFYE